MTPIHRTINYGVPWDEPFHKFNHWYYRAGQGEGQHGYPANACTLSTVSQEGWPSSRIVLLKGVDTGMTFFGNYHSQKGRELDANPMGSLCFWWPSQQKQVRVSGTTHRLTKEENEAYFATRPRSSQIGAWASYQSSQMESMRLLEGLVSAYSKMFEGETVPCPPTWGGWRLTPKQFEFWTDGYGRLHERIVYDEDANAPHTWIQYMKFP